MFNGWMISDADRAQVLGIFPPLFSCVRASHVTQSLDVDEIPVDADITIVGYACDDGLEALVVAVDGSIERPDGGTYHVTLSRREERASKESNDVIARGWKSVESITVRGRGFINKGDIYVTTSLSA